MGEVPSTNDSGNVSPRSLARHGEAADSEQIIMEDYHCSGCEVFGDLVKVGENDRCLLSGSASDQAADEDHRRIAGLLPGEEAAEVGVGGDQDLPVSTGAFEDRFIGRCLHAEIAHVHGVVPSCLQRVG
jgi:hypothetical protein